MTGEEGGSMRGFLTKALTTSAIPAIAEQSQGGDTNPLGAALFAHLQQLLRQFPHLYAPNIYVLLS